ncbi:MAG: HAD family phosphatase [bacterium]|nr:HAD family phosphatase [bacterium]
MMYKAVIFDMDGTLTVPYINWSTLRAAISCPPDKTIIAHIDSLPPDRARAAREILLATEREAAERAEMNAGAADLVDALRQRGLKLALVTNNHREAMQIVLKRYGLHFDSALSRDDGVLKPAPDLILKALDALGAKAEDALGIGDSIYDTQACAAAKVRCLYLTHGSPRFDHEPAIASLGDMLAFLDRA